MKWRELIERIGTCADVAVDEDRLTFAIPGTVRGASTHPPLWVRLERPGILPALDVSSDAVEYAPVPLSRCDRLRLLPTYLRLRRRSRLDSLTRLATLLDTHPALSLDNEQRPATDSE